MRQRLSAGDHLASAAAAGAGLLMLLHLVFELPPALPACELQGMLAAALGMTALGLLRRAGMFWRAAASVLLAAAAAPWSPAADPLTGWLLRPALVLLALAAWPWPKRLAAPTVLALHAVLALLWAVWAAALAALLPGPLLLDGLPAHPGLSWPTLAVLGLLALAVTLRTLQSPPLRRYYAGREDRRIFAVSLGLLFGTAVLATTLMGALLTAQAVRLLEPALHRSVHAQAQALELMLSQARRAGAAAARGLLAADDAADPPPQRVTQALRQLAALGQAGIEWQHADGSRSAEGRLHAGPWLPLAAAVASGPGQLALGFDQGLVLRLQPPLAAAGTPGLTIQLRPSQPQAQLAPLDLLGAASEVMLCAPAGSASARCLSGSRAQMFEMALPPRADDEPWPVQRAWRGGDGVALLHGPQGEALAVAYAPLGAHGLALMQRLPLMPLLQRSSDAALPVLALMAALVGAGAVLLWRRSFPPLRSLRAAKAQLQATLGHLPRGVLTLDDAGRVIAANARARQLCGLDAAQLLGRRIDSLLFLRDSDQPWTPAAGSTEVLLRTAAPPDPAGAQVLELSAERFAFEGRTRWLLLLRDLRRELRRRAELLRWESIFVHAHWGVATMDPDSLVLTLVNPAFARMHGATVDALRGTSIAQLVAPAERAQVAARAERMRRDGHLRLESWHLRGGVQAFAVLVDVSLVRDPAGGVYAVVNVQDMSEQRRAQDALRRNESLLQAVLAALPVGVWIGDREGRIVATNPAVQRLWGGVPPLRDGRPLAAHTRRAADGRLIGADDYPLLRAIRSGRTVEPELLEVETADGSWRTLLSTAVPLIGEDGRIDGAIAVHEDLTLLHRAEAAGEAARHFFERLFQSAAVGMAVWDAQGRLQRVNRALCELLGGDEATLLAGSLRAFGDPASLHSDLAAFERLCSGEATRFEAERCWRRCDGQPLWVLMTVSLLPPADGQPPQFVAQLLDIDSSRRFQLALRASEARLQQAQRIARVADWELDSAQGLLRMSAQGWRMLGRPTEADSALPLAQWLALVHEDDRDALQAALLRCLADGRPLAQDWRIRADGGEAGVFHLQGERVAGEHDGAPRLVGALQDISERKRAETELMRSRQRLRELSANEEARIEQERRHIAREVHDELGQALTALKMELSLLQRQAQRALHDEDGSAAARIANAIRMVDDTVRVARHIAGNLRPAALDYGLCAAIEWLAEDFGLRYELPCELRISGEEVTLDELRAISLFRIVQESLTNVARHAQAQRVRIGLRFAAARLSVSVQDDGVGFAAAVQQRSGHFGLLGMRERALKVGAHWRVRSRPGGGCTVRVVLPLEQTA